MAVIVGQAIACLTKDAEGVSERTLDTLKSGRPDGEVRHVAVMFTAGYEAIRQAVEAGVDLIVTHEPTFFNHRDETGFLAGDPVYERKRALIEESGVAIFRLHDYIHAYRPDGILVGMLRQLEWEDYADPEDLNVLILPERLHHTPRTLVTHLEAKLGIDGALVAGDPDRPVGRIALLPGATGYGAHIRYLSRPEIDLLIVGETNEWETNEYVRDAVDMGLAKALIVAGHQKSEEAGMRIAAERLREAFPELRVTFVETPRAVKRI